MKLPLSPPTLAISKNVHTIPFIVSVYNMNALYQFIEKRAEPQEISYFDRLLSFDIGASSSFSACSTTKLSSSFDQDEGESSLILALPQEEHIRQAVGPKMDRSVWQQEYKMIRKNDLANRRFRFKRHKSIDNADKSSIFEILNLSKSQDTTNGGPSVVTPIDSTMTSVSNGTTLAIDDDSIDDLSQSSDASIHILMRYLLCFTTDTLRPQDWYA